MQEKNCGLFASPHPVEVCTMATILHLRGDYFHISLLYGYLFYLMLSNTSPKSEKTARKLLPGAIGTAAHIAPERITCPASKAMPNSANLFANHATARAG